MVTSTFAVRQTLQIGAESDSNQPTVVIATTDTEIQATMSKLLEHYSLRTVYAKSLEEVKSIVSSRKVAACFCSFWLIDGTYRDVIKHLRKQPSEIPAIIVCSPECPQEYRDYLAALNMRAFGFMCHPYRRADFEQILESAIGLQNQVPERTVHRMPSASGSLAPAELPKAS